MKDSEKMSYLFRHREQESNAEIKDNNSEKKTKEKESDK
nr:MAG TPA: hypothetical protein [Caudoviricetes sp.]